MAYDYLTAESAYEADLESIQDLRESAEPKRTAIETAIASAVLTHLTLEEGDYSIVLYSDNFVLRGLSDYEFTTTQLSAFEAAFENAELTISDSYITVEFTAPP